MATLGETIRARRDELGMTQEQLAERLGYNVRQSEISRLEHDRVNLPRRPRLEQLANALELPIGELLVRSGWAGAEDLPDAHDGPTSRQMHEHLGELRIANADLQHQVNDLERANESWQRWGADKILDLRVAEAAITQLEAVLDAIPYPVVVVSPAGVVLVENEAYAAFSARHGDTPAMLDGDGVALLPEAHPLERVCQGEGFTMQLRIDGDPQSAYMVHGQVTTTIRGGRIGVVIFHPLTA